MPTGCLIKVPADKGMGLVAPKEFRQGQSRNVEYPGVRAVITEDDTASERLILGAVFEKCRHDSRSKRISIDVGGGHGRMGHR